MDGFPSRMHGAVPGVAVVMPLTPGGSPHGPADAWPLKPIAGYVVGERLGVGGAAEVYAARRVSDDVPVAIKVLRSDVAQLVGIDRFLREIVIMGQVQSPRLVPLLDSGEVDGLPYYIMPLATGGTLRSRLDRDGVLPVREALAVADQLADALVTLHAAGLIHRDVKPENVLIGADGGVQLADYGIARALVAAGLDPITTTGIILGTPPYMSPEQGSGDTVDARSDLYSLGCVLYELLGGAPPFHAATALGLMARHRSDPPPALQAVRPDLPAGVEALVRQLLAKVPADRPASAIEVRRLIAAVDAGGAPAPAGGTMPSPPEGRRRRWAVAVISAAVVLAAGAGLWRRAVPARPLDPGRVVVFPFSANDSVTEEGERIALLVGSAFETAEPLRWIDGWSLLSPAERQRAVPPALDTLSRIARQAGARYFVTGVLGQAGDSTRVSALLHDVTDAGATVRRTAVGAADTPVGRLALTAVVDLLPRLIGSAGADIGRLADHDPAAVAMWLQGERLYRASRMAESVALMTQALARDSGLARAALRGAMAAAWIPSDRALPLVQVALAHEADLSPRQRLLARALTQYLTGQADSAIVAIRALIAADSSAADSWTLAGETYRHLLPTLPLDPAVMGARPVPAVWPVRAMSRDAFARAAASDSLFSPALEHLADDALMRADVATAGTLLRRLELAGVPAAERQSRQLALDCLRSGPTAVRWRGAGPDRDSTILRAGTVLAAGTADQARQCARRAFGVILDADTTIASNDWGALLGLVGLEGSDGHDVRALALVDSAVASGLAAAAGLYVILDVAGVAVGDRASRFVAPYANGVEPRSPQLLWLLALWHATRGDSATVRRWHAALAARVRGAGTRLDTLLAGAANGWLALSRGDTVRALEQFVALAPNAPPSQLGVSLWEPLGLERLQLARLQLARGDARLAHRTASVFDQPETVLFPLLVGPSVRLRLQAARQLGDSSLVRAAQARLAVPSPR